MKYFIKVALGLLLIAAGFVLIFLGMYYRMQFPTYGKVLGFIFVVVGYFLIVFSFLSNKR